MNLIIVNIESKEKLNLDNYPQKKALRMIVNVKKKRNREKKR